MPFNPNVHHRQSIRLKGYDYTQAGFYFVTLCAYERECLFSNVVKGEMVLNAFGKIVEDYWQALPHHFERVQLDAFVVMPNHLHGLILIDSEVKHSSSSSSSGTARDSLSAIIQNFKSVPTRKVNQEREVSGWHLWQRNYYEHIVRNEVDLRRIRKYVADNPLKWDLDQLNPKNEAG
jgi:putative transposase